MALINHHRCLGLLAGLALGLMSRVAAADECQSYWTAAYKCAQGCGPCGNEGSSNVTSSGPSQEDIEEAQRVQRNAQVHAINVQANEAWERRDYREALRLYEQQQALRDGPNVRGDILNVRALIAWEAATTAADYRRALAMQPSLFSPENVRYVDALERKEQRERQEAEEERRRVTQNREAVASMRTRLGQFASSLDPPVPGPGLKVEGTTADAFGTVKASATPLEFGDPTSLEAASDRSRGGFDAPGALSRTPADPSTPEPRGRPVVDQDPRMISAVKELDGLRLEHQRLEAELARLTQERSAAVEANRQQALTAELAAKTRAEQEARARISQSTTRVEKLRRVIETEVEAPADRKKKGPRAAKP